MTMSVLGCALFQNKPFGSYLGDPWNNFESDYTLLHPFYINKKVASKGIDGCYIGESWRKVAEIG